MQHIHAFAFDGTLTSRDTLIAFIRFGCGRRRLWLGLLRFLPMLVAMKLHCYPNWKSKQRVFTHFFGGMEQHDFTALCQRFAAEHTHLMRPAAIATLREIQQTGHPIVIISASIDDWVRPFFASLHIEADVIGTQVEVIDGRLTGRFSTPNCYGAEKVRRLLEHYPDRKSYTLTAYGDSRGDRELLAEADEAHYKPFN